MEKGDPCVLTWPDGERQRAIFWEAIGGHQDVVIDGSTWCILPGEATVEPRPQPVK